MNEEKSNKPHCTTEAFIKNISDIFFEQLYLLFLIFYSLNMGNLCISTVLETSF